MEHRMKMKESKKIDKYQDLTRELKKLWNIKVMMILNEVGILGTVPKNLIKNLGELEIREVSKPSRTYHS